MYDFADSNVCTMTIYGIPYSVVLHSKDVKVLYLDKSPVNYKHMLISTLDNTCNVRHPYMVP